MTYDEIIIKANDKAVENGYTFRAAANFKHYLDASIISSNVNPNWYFIFIFDHDFAKAFWPDIVVDGEKNQFWQYHLQQMVLEPEPLKYLEKFL